MATTYPVELLNPEGTEVIQSGLANFTSATNAPANNQNPIVSGALSQLAVWVSGTAQQNPVSRTIEVVLAVTGDATNNAATCAIALSPDNVTFTTVVTVSLAAAVNNTGAVTLPAFVKVPTGWYIRLTLSHTTVAQSSYY
jgi:hypothetical protein